ncbi:hypothetical protein Tco_0732427 [Tanacetum coccineum]
MFMVTIWNSFKYFIDKEQEEGLPEVVSKAAGGGKYGHRGWRSFILRSEVVLSLLQRLCGDIYEDHVVSFACIIGIKLWHNVVRDTLVDIRFRSGISVGKEVDIGLGGGHDGRRTPTSSSYVALPVGRRA